MPVQPYTNFLNISILYMLFHNKPLSLQVLRELFNIWKFSPFNVDELTGIHSSNIALIRNIIKNNFLINYIDHEEEPLKVSLNSEGQNYFAQRRKSGFQNYLVFLKDTFKEDTSNTNPLDPFINVGQSVDIEYYDTLINSWNKYKDLINGIEMQVFNLRKPKEKRKPKEPRQPALDDSNIKNGLATVAVELLLDPNVSIKSILSNILSKLEALKSKGVTVVGSQNIDEDLIPYFKEIRDAPTPITDSSFRANLSQVLKSVTDKLDEIVSTEMIRKTIRGPGPSFFAFPTALLLRGEEPRVTTASQLIKRTRTEEYGSEQPAPKRFTHS